MEVKTRKQGNAKFEIQIEEKHVNGSRKTMFQYNSEFGGSYLSLVLLLSVLGEKNNCLEKATVQSPWATDGMATARNLHGHCRFNFLSCTPIWLQINAFLGGHCFTWFDQEAEVQEAYIPLEACAISAVAATTLSNQRQI